MSCRSIASLLAAAVCAAGCPGDDETCGAKVPAGETGMLLTVDGQSYAAGPFHASANADCPPDGKPAQEPPVSVTILPDTSAGGAAITLCLPRPDQVANATVDLGDTTLVHLQDVNVVCASDGCDYRLFPGMAPAGTVRFEGFCDTNGVVFNMTLDGQVAGIRRCPQDGGAPVEVQVVMTLAGTVQVRDTTPIQQRPVRPQAMSQLGVLW